MTTYEYTREYDGGWNIDNYTKINEDGSQFTLRQDIDAALPGKSYSVQYFKTKVLLNFSQALSAGDKTTLDSTVSSHKSYEGGLIESIAKDWSGYKDYEDAWETMKSTMDYNGFDNLSSTEQAICSHWFVASKSDRDTIHTQAEQEANGEIYQGLIIKSRSNRYEKIINLLTDRLNSSDANSVIIQLRQNVLVSCMDYKYINYGIKGTDYGDSSAIADYIEAIDIFNLTGLAVQTYTPTYGTLAALVSDILDIIQNG